MLLFLMKGQSSSTSSNTDDGTIYHNSSLVNVRFDFTGDGSGISQPRYSSIVAINGVMEYYCGSM